ncbi:pentapeptide repeat-containing protein [Micromonospora purpureochromogenes]|uniref:pentapeptide repeat-containing protein n=1 Tax=Micromonospora purpureochromogenes TaxID=47872 RepID=UPI0033C739BA
MSPVMLIAVAAASVVVTGVVAYWMWTSAQVPPSASPESPDILVRRAQLRVDLIRNLLGVCAGTGALVALFIAIRRQYVQERVDHTDQELKACAAADSKHDAGERRLTELYVKAAEQLGSDKAPVRLASLYALERIGKDNPAHRQTIADVICAYLRMPYDPPETEFSYTSEEEKRRKEDEQQRRREEREVRLTAQGILRRRMYRPIITLGEESTADIWDVSLDLSHATLINFDLAHCVANAIDVKRARFIGPARFRGIECRFAFIAEGAIFGDDAVFAQANFGANAVFSDAKFRGEANFGQIDFADRGLFVDTVFIQGVSFENHQGRDFLFDGALVTVNPYDCSLPRGWRLGGETDEFYKVVTDGSDALPLSASPDEGA